MIPLRDLNPTRTRPFITVGLIAANILVFLYQITLGVRAQNQFVLAYATTYETVRADLKALTGSA